jgi:hypothetical protein
MNTKIQQNINNSIDISQLINEDIQQKSDSMAGFSETIHTKSYSSHAITTEFGKENLEYIDKIIRFKSH